MLSWYPSQSLSPTDISTYTCMDRGRVGNDTLRLRALHMTNGVSAGGLPKSLQPKMPPVVVAPERSTPAGESPSKRPQMRTNAEVTSPPRLTELGGFVPGRWRGLYQKHTDTLAGPLWEVYRESRRCSRDTYSMSYITKFTSLRRSANS